MNQQSSSSGGRGEGERRAHVRWPVADSSGFGLEIHGFDELGKRVDVSCELLNLSRGGLLGRTDTRLNLDTVCMAQLLGADDAVHPTYAVGRVNRLAQADSFYLVAIEFDRPLMKLEIPERRSA